MSIRVSLSRKTPNRPASFLVPTSASSRILPRARTITTTHPTHSKSRASPPNTSIFGKFFGIQPRQPAPVDPSNLLRDAADTLRVLLQTSPPVRPALLHKPYAELVDAALAYRAKEADPLDLTTIGKGQSRLVEDDLKRLAGDPNSGLDYLSTLIKRLTEPGIPHPGDLELALRVYGDVRSVFGCVPSWDDGLCLARARALLRQPAEAMEVLGELDPPPGSGEDVWALVACAGLLSSESAPDKAASDEVRAVMRTMAAKGVEPPPGAWCALLAAARPGEVGPILKALPESVKGEARVWAAALEVLMAGGGDRIEEVAETLRGIVERGGVVDTHAWAALVVYAGRTKDTSGGDDPNAVVRAFDRAGGRPDTVILRALIRALPVSERTLDTLRKFESLVGVEADESVWGVLVDAAIEEGESVVGVWSAASDSGINLSSETLDRVVQSDRVSMVEKLMIYRAVNAAWPLGKEKERDIVEGVDVWMRREDALSVPGPTVRTYSALLGALVARRGNELDRTTASAAAVELLTDMRQREIRFPHIAQASTSPSTSRSGRSRPQTPTPLSPLASLTILLMENAPSHDAAFKTYAYACVVDPTGGSFGTREYRAVLRAFAGLRIARNDNEVLRDEGADNWTDTGRTRGRKTEVYAPPPAALYYEIMRDVQRAGYDVEVTDYSTILRAYASVCVAPPDETDDTELVPQTRKGTASAALARAHNAQVMEHIQRVHTLLKLDTNLTPDTMLLNSLMLAYGHAGALENVLAIWDGMKDRHGGWDSASVSIVLDALGRSGRANLPRARLLWDRLRKRYASRLTVNNYTSWVEALCRLGEFSEAERVVFVDMKGNVRPDEKTLRTLVSFAWRVGRQAQVLEDVKRKFPGVV